MYYIYDIQKNDREYSFERVKAISLRGSTNGVIVPYLRELFDERMRKQTGELGEWRINVPEAVESWKRRTRVAQGNALIMNLAPSDPDQIGLYEIKRIWGFTKYNWTPMMLESLPVVDDLRTDVPDETEFVLPIGEYVSLPNVYSFLYMRDTKTAGGFSGTWNPPPPSSANTPVLYPEVLEYFMSEIGYRRTGALETLRVSA